jgi:hypothetical protein
MGSRGGLRQKERQPPYEDIDDKRFLPSRLERVRVKEEAAEEIVFEAEDLIREENVSYGGSSSRLAILNLDWEMVNARELFRTMESFLPEGGSVFSLTIYKSKEGKACLEKEEREGPQLHPRDSSEKSMKIAIRKYILQRMRWFYAVAQFDSPGTAEAIYKAVDGAEIDQTKNYVDLRFVPEGYAIEDEASEQATEGGAPNEKILSASVYHSNVSLRWEEDVKRISYLRSLFLEEDLDLSRAKDLVDMDGEDEDEEKQELYRRLLLGSAEKEKARTKKDRHAGREKRRRARKSEKEEDVEVEGGGFVFDREDPRFKDAAARREFAVDVMDPAHKKNKRSGRE